MRDLELRGAGNLLGDEQSGHVAALGFELYMQMLDEAVAELGGEGTARRTARAGPPRRRTSTPTCRPTTSPTSRRRSTFTADRGGARGRRAARAARRAGGPLRTGARAAGEPARSSSRRGSSSGAGARAVSFRGGRLAVTPIELDSRGGEAPSRGDPEALYEPGKSQLSCACRTTRRRVPGRRAGRRRAARGHARTGRRGRLDRVTAATPAKAHACLGDVGSPLRWGDVTRLI